MEERYQAQESALPALFSIEAFTSEPEISGSPCRPKSTARNAFLQDAPYRNGVPKINPGFMNAISQVQVDTHT